MSFEIDTVSSRSPSFFVEPEINTKIFENLELSNLMSVLEINRSSYEIGIQVLSSKAKKHFSTLKDITGLILPKIIANHLRTVHKELSEKSDPCKIVQEEIDHPTFGGTNMIAG